MAAGACPIELHPGGDDRLAAGISHAPYLASVAAFAVASHLAQGDAMVWQSAVCGIRSTTCSAGSRRYNDG